ncbi:zinc-binding dehydrogenase [Alloalcanivorax gelatiniphagus]
MNDSAVMKAAFVRSKGPTDQIRYDDLPIPDVGPTDVLLRMEATTVNHVDLFVRSGAYQTPTPLPLILGRDVVGTVEQVGTHIEDVAVGQRVWSNSLGHDGRQGTFSQFVVAPRERVYALPSAVDPLEAVSVLHAGATAHIGLFREARLCEGETVLVAGAGGAVGSAVAQMARAAGARVIATAAPRDFDRVLQRGADVVLDYNDRDLNAAIAAAAPQGIDVWWDNSGHNDLSAALPILRQRGRVILMAGMTTRPHFQAGSLYTRDLSILGFAISNASSTDLADAAEAINTLLANGQLTGRVGQVLNLSQSRTAHELMEAGGHAGRIVVIP